MTFEEFWEGVPLDPEDDPDEISYVKRIAEAAWSAALREAMACVIPDGNPVLAILKIKELRKE